MEIRNSARINHSLAHSQVWKKMLGFYSYLKPGLWVMSLPLVGPLVQKMAIRRGRDMGWFLPVQEAIPTGSRYALPKQIIEQLLIKAEGIFAMAACPCRTAFECQNHPRDIGCLHLGPLVQQIPPEIGHVLTLEEAQDHLNRAIASGLMPTILHIQSEAELFQIQKSKMISICFCCECCCDARLILRYGPERYWDLYCQRLPGVRVTVNEDCSLCGECVAACYGGERVITLGAMKAEIGERCIGCGRCVPACPNGAISLELAEEGELVPSLLERISTRVDILCPAGQDLSDSN